MGTSVSIMLFSIGTETQAASPSEKRKAWQQAEQAADRYSDSDEAYRAAMTAYEQGRYHEAFELISRLFEQSPDSEPLNFALGSAAYAIGKLSHATVAFERVLEPLDLAVSWETYVDSCIGFDDRGKVRLSMKVVDQTTGEEIKEEPKEKSED